MRVVNLDMKSDELYEILAALFNGDENVIKGTIAALDDYVIMEDVNK